MDPIRNDKERVWESVDDSVDIDTEEVLGRVLGSSMGMYQDDSEPSSPVTTPVKAQNKLLSRRAASAATPFSDKKGDPAPAPAPMPPPNTATPPAMRGTIPQIAPKPDRHVNFIGGRNIGSNANEPVWTNEDRKEIERATRFMISTTILTETRRSVADPRSEFVRKTAEGTFICTSKTMLPNAPLGSYILGFGPAKEDQKLDKRSLYSDVVMVGAKKDWILSQWTSMDVIMEGVPESLLSKAPRMNRGNAERRIGHHFARFGFPKKSFGPMFETLSANIPGILSKFTSTEGYYWANASWGVTGSAGTFAYVDEDRRKVEMQDLSAAMRMIMDSSSYGVGTFAVSTSVRYKIQNEQKVPITDTYEISLKCHNMFHMKCENYHGPPQSASTGFELGDDLLAMAQPLHKPAAMNQFLKSSSGMFGVGNTDAFSNLGLNGDTNTQEKAGANNGGSNSWL